MVFKNISITLLSLNIFAYITLRTTPLQAKNTNDCKRQDSLCALPFEVAVKILDPLINTSQKDEVSNYTCVNKGWRVLINSALRHVNIEVNPEGIDNFEAYLHKLKSLESLTLKASEKKETNKSSFFVQLVDIIGTKAPNLKHLSIELENSAIETHEINALTNSLKKFKKLKSIKLNLAKTHLSSAGLIDLTNLLKKLTWLTSLSLSLSLDDSIHAKEINNLITTLEHLTNLTELSLNLANTHLGSTELIALTNLLKKLTGLITLSLNLANNSRDSTEEINNLITTLEDLTSLTKLNLNLAKTHLRSTELIALTKSLKNLTGLTSLSLSLKNNDEMSSEAIDNLINILGELTSLTYLSLSPPHKMIGHEEINPLKETLKKLINLNSLSLDLTNIEMLSIAVDQLANTLKQLTGLVSLKLLFSETVPITDGGTSELTKALEELHKLISLDLQLKFERLDERIYGDGWASLVALLGQLTGLTNLSLNLTGNISNPEVKTLATKLAKLINLTSLNLKINGNVRDPLLWGNKWLNLPDPTHWVNQLMGNVPHYIDNLYSVSILPDIEVSLLSINCFKYVKYMLQKQEIRNYITKSGAEVLIREIKKLKNLASIDLNIYGLMHIKSLEN